MPPTVDRAQLAALRALRRQLGTDAVRVLEVLELGGGCGSSGAPAPDTGEQLALTVEEVERTSNRESSTGAAGLIVAGAVLDAPPGTG